MDTLLIACRHPVLKLGPIKLTGVHLCGNVLIQLNNKFEKMVNFRGLISWKKSVGLINSGVTKQLVYMLLTFPSQSVGLKILTC